MRNINIAVIDSGLNVTSDMDLGKITYVYSCDNSSFRDENGHGTNVVQTILLHERRVNIFIFKIFHKALECELEELINALKIIYLRLPYIDIVNMSLGIEKNDLQLKNYCEKISERGTKIVAAYNNNSEKESFPASYSWVYGVKSTMYKNSYEYSRSCNNDVRIYGYLPYFIIQKTHITCMGNSFAAAHFTGVLANSFFSNISTLISDNDFDTYIQSLEKFDRAKKNVILIDDNNVLNLWNLKCRDVIGKCIYTEKGYYIKLDAGIKVYDTLVIDNYNSPTSMLLSFVITNIKSRKNIFSISGFDECINMLLYSLSMKYDCNMYIKYVC